MALLLEVTLCCLLDHSLGLSVHLFPLPSRIPTWIQGGLIILAYASLLPTVRWSVAAALFHRRVYWQVLLSVLGPTAR